MNAILGLSVISRHLELSYNLRDGICADECYTQGMASAVGGQCPAHGDELYLHSFPQVIVSTTVTFGATRQGIPSCQHNLSYRE